VGPQGPQGLQGPAGSGGDGGGRLVIDAVGVEVGYVDLMSGVVTRKFNGDTVMFSMTPQGIAQSSITFHHTTADCSGERYMDNFGGYFAYAGFYLGGSVFYTRLADSAFPMLPQPIRSEEQVNIGANPMALGVCTPKAPHSMSVGPAVAVTDPVFNALAAPFRLK